MLANLKNGGKMSPLYTVPDVRYINGMPTVICEGTMVTSREILSRESRYISPCTVESAKYVRDIGRGIASDGADYWLKGLLAYA